MRFKKTFTAVVFGLVLGLSGCGSKYESEPIGVGRDPAKLKVSPCACLKLETKEGLPKGLS